MKKENILFIIENISLVGGTEKAIISLAKILISSGNYYVSVLSVESQEVNEVYDISSEIKIIHLDCHKRFFKKYGIIAKKIDELDKAHKINYLVSSGHNFSCFLFPLFAKKIKCVACEHINRDMLPFPIRFLQKIFYPKLYRTVVLTPSEKEKYKFLGKNVIVIPNNIDNFYVERAPKNLILAVGRLEHIKGFDILINSISLIKDLLTNYEVQICGNGSLKDDLQNQINKLELQNIIKLVPAHDLRNDYSTAKIFVLSSREESFGLALIEAMQSGIPCVAFKSSGPDFILQNDYEILIEQNEKFLANRILKLVSDESLQKRIVEKQNNYLKEFSTEKIKEQWLEKVFC